MHTRKPLLAADAAAFVRGVPRPPAPSPIACRGPCSSCC